MKFKVNNARSRVKTPPAPDAYVKKVVTITLESKEEERGFGHMLGCGTMAGNYNKCNESELVKKVLKQLENHCTDFDL